MEGAVKKGIEAEAARVLIRSSRERNEVTVVRLNTKKVRQGLGHEISLRTTLRRPSLKVSSASAGRECFSISRTTLAPRLKKGLKIVARRKVRGGAGPDAGASPTLDVDQTTLLQQLKDREDPARVLPTETATAHNDVEGLLG
mmetsp:Transcript_10848/g.28948  ORF Transcript_10848/g.28948 Transcript_10848/m.28948 type:complete len:143 (+) Transcript_10848:1628-2056(+)